LKGCQRECTACPSGGFSSAPSIDKTFGCLSSDATGQYVQVLDVSGILSCLPCAAGMYKRLLTWSRGMAQAASLMPRGGPGIGSGLISVHHVPVPSGHGSRSSGSSRRRLLAADSSAAAAGERLTVATPRRCCSVGCTRRAVAPSAEKSVATPPVRFPLYKWGVSYRECSGGALRLDCWTWGRTAVPWGLRGSSSGATIRTKQPPAATSSSPASTHISATVAAAAWAALRQAQR